MQDEGCWEGVSHPLEEVIARVYKKVSVRFPESGSTSKAFPSDARIVESPPPLAPLPIAVWLFRGHYLACSWRT